MDAYLEHQYSEKKRITNLKEKVNSNGKVVEAVESRLSTYTINLANTQGMKNMKYNDLSKIGEKVINSNVDSKLFFYIIKHQGANSMLKKSYGQELATTSYLAKKFNVTPQKVRKFIRECLEEGLIKKLKTHFIVNPYISAPYKATNNQLHRLQVWYDEDPEYILIMENEIDIDDFEKESIRIFAHKIIGEKEWTQNNYSSIT